MKTATTMILSFLIGFYGTSLFTDTPEQMLLKSKIFLYGVIIATILKMINDNKTK